MKPKSIRAASALLAGITLAFAPMAAMAAVSEAEAAKLGKELTPVGAERAGNKDGTIPAWAPEAKRGAPKGEYPNNAKIDGEKPLYSITAANMAQYADKLTEGHKELLKRYPASYKLNVYPSHRFANFPQKVLDETVKNATRAKLDGVDNASGALIGFPFPIPKTGAEPVWNHRVKFRGSDIRRFNNQMIVQPDGRFALTKIVEDVTFSYANIESPNAPELKPGADFLRYLSETLSPPRIAGTTILVHEKAGFGPEGRAAWLYAPALKRIRRAPAVCCDNPYEGTDGHQFYDQVDMYNGVLERFTWKLLGKREMYIPYNSNKIAGPSVKYADMARPNHMNVDLPRYELHRVWVVEATVRAGLRHSLIRRTFYLDEDSWSIAAVDGYDGQGKLWKVQEAHLVTLPFLPTTTGSPEVIYDLRSGRYFVTALSNEDAISDFEISFDDDAFAPASLQRKARKR